MTIELEARTVNTAGTYRTIMQPVAQVYAQKRLGSPVLLSKPGLVLSKESSLQETMTRTAPGPADLTYTATGEGATRTLTLEALESTGAWTRRLSSPLAAGGVLTTVPLVLPASPIRATIANGTAGEITVDLLIGAT